MKSKTSFVWWVGWGVWVVMFTAVGYERLDPDFGWHIKAGEYIARYGVAKTDPFSYTMPSYPFIDHEWLTNWLMYQITQKGGYGVMSLAFGLLAGALWWILVPRRDLIFAIVPWMLGAGVWAVRGGVRPQVLDWIFLAGLLRLVWEERVWKKWRWLTVPTFCLWANLHGGFAIGPVVLGVIIVFKTWENKRADKKDILIWLAGMLATWINPYGWRVWHEVWMQMTDSGLRWNIAEWQPFWVKAELGVWLLVALAWAVAAVNRESPEKWKLGVSAGLLLAGMSSLRHVSLLTVMMVLLASEQLRWVYRKIARNKLSDFRARKFYLIILMISALLFIAEAGVTVVRAMRGQGSISYPSQAVEHLRRENYSGNVFSDYGWGGYLIWKYPEKRVFIDGRMPSWRWNAPQGESDWAFKDYVRIRDKGEYEEFFDKYNVGVVLWPKSGRVNNAENAEWKWWNKIKGIFQKEKKQIDLAEKLKINGWNIKYEDKTTQIWVRP